MDSATNRQHYDVVVVGGGHNGLTSAAYLAGAGLSVLVLERLPHVGGAAVSERTFPGRAARLSRYSYLVSVLPEQVIADLGLELAFATRRTASYTPWRRAGTDGGLLVEHEEGEATRASFRELTGGDAEHRAWQEFYGRVGDFAATVAPTLVQPLPTDREIRSRVDPTTWRELVEEPIGRAVEARFADDTVRGVVATDALIGTFASVHDTSLVQNRCFLYHLVGNGTGEWRVPVGGMGAVTDALAGAATDAGAELLTGADVSTIRTGPAGAEVTWHDATGRRGVTADRVLSCVAPWVLQTLLGEDQDPAVKPVGAQLKINLLLDRLPRLRSGADPEVAFAGTLHLSEDLSQLEQAYADAAAGRVPTRMPGEVYCHSLSDRSILGEDGVHTLTYFGLHAPATLFDAPGAKQLAVDRALDSLDEHLVDPIRDCLATDGEGNPCLEAKVPQDIEADLAMPGGHIFHGDLAWPWAPAQARLDTPARQWGVATDHAAVLLCGSGARRGGAVSGLGGHNAARAVLAER